MNDPNGNLVNVQVDRVEVDDRFEGVFLFDGELDLRVFVPLSGAAPFLFEHERRAPHPLDKQLSVIEVMRRMHTVRA